MPNALPHAVRRAQQTRRISMIAIAGRQSRKAFQRVVDPQVPPDAGGDRQGVMRIPLGSFRLTICDLHKGTQGQRHHLIPAAHRGDGLVGQATGGRQVTAGQCGFGERGGAAGEHFPRGSDIAHRRLGRLYGRLSVTLDEGSMREQGIDRVFGGRAHRF